ncbi:phosphotransferase [Kineococcus sp. NPDC059986]|uniref:phosphotransferase family protein n=1 Tax=Kineococcus sp. NPDC059986 TaxID=3155538 RepID=UPI00344BEA10
MDEERLPHGSTNATRRDAGVVTKRYRGPDAERRQRVEVSALRNLAGTFPVPALLHEEAGRIDTAHVAGRPGQDLLEVAPDAVLHSVGRAAARLHCSDSKAFAAGGELGPAVPGAVPVHGDFGPQNLLLDPEPFEVTAVVDWEFAHLGDGVLDLAWAEWIVRTHHPHLVRSLPRLFDGYGAEPAWDRRKAAMVARCEWALAFVTRWDPDEESARSTWRDRLTATLAFAP